MTPVPHQKGQQWAHEQISCHQSCAALSTQTSTSSSTHSQLWFSLRRSTLMKNRYHSKTKAVALWQINDQMAEVVANEADPLATRLVRVSFIDPLLQWRGCVHASHTGGAGKPRRAVEEHTWFEGFAALSLGQGCGSASISVDIPVCHSK